MPTYDYECGACGRTVEIFHSMTEEPRRKCPECGKLKLKRLLGTGGGFLFKGEGFYITDYRSSDYKAQAKAESDAASSSKSDSSSKSESSGESKKSSTDSGSGSDSTSKKSDADKKAG